jgi:hypothetical protein
MSDQIRKFTEGFFRNLKCEISNEKDILVVANVPKSFEDVFGRAAPYRFSFISGDDGEFVGRGSALLTAITKFLEGVGKTTLLKINFDVDPMKEIKGALFLKNCDINNIVKKHKNNFFSRFTFITTFRYLNESEQIVNEIYIYNGKVVDGDLSGYTVIDGDGDKVLGDSVKGDYNVAKNVLKEKLSEKTEEIGETLGKRVEIEIERIRVHYDNLLGELGGDLSGAIEKIREVELAFRNAGSEEEETLRVRLDKLRKGLVKMGDDEARDKILKEQGFTINNEIHKHSLNIDNKLVNTTVIYYPVFRFNLFLQGDNSGRFVEMNYDPLTKTLDKLVCESCGKDIVRLNLCSAGHISCDDCLERCGECGKYFCKKCLKRNCSVCGETLCKSCSITCIGCGNHVCKNHMRKDCVTGDDRCASCMRACMRCHGMAQEKYFGKAMDGSKICQKCLGAEKRGKAIKNVFRD